MGVVQANGGGYGALLQAGVLQVCRMGQGSCPLGAGSLANSEQLGSCNLASANGFRDRHHHPMQAGVPSRHLSNLRRIDR